MVASNASIDPKLQETRESPAVMRGTCTLHSINNQTVFAFVRYVFQIIKNVSKKMLLF